MPDEWAIEFYEDDRGRRPVADFISSLRSNPALQAKLLRTLDLLMEFGTALSMPHSRAMTGYDFRELRVRYASDIARILYYALPGRKMVMLHGFVKKSQRTPAADLQVAQRRLEDLRARRGL